MHASVNGPIFTFSMWSQCYTFNMKSRNGGKNVYGIPILDACSDLTKTRECGHIGGVFVFSSSSSALPPIVSISIVGEAEYGSPNEL